MPLRKRTGTWHYRFWEDGHEYTGNTGVAALEVTGHNKTEDRKAERNKAAAAVVENKARELVRNGRAQELKLHGNRSVRRSRAFLNRQTGNTPINRTLLNDYTRVLPACHGSLASLPFLRFLPVMSTTSRRGGAKSTRSRRSPFGTTCTRCQRHTVTSSTTIGHAKIRWMASISPATKTRSECTFFRGRKKSDTSRTRAGIRRCTTLAV